MHEETRRQTNQWKKLAYHFCKDLSFTSKYPEVEVVLQRIKEFLFTNNSKHKLDLVISAKHNQEIHTSIHLKIGQETYRIL
jgi:hypothetical protein